MGSFAMFILLLCMYIEILERLQRVGIYIHFGNVCISEDFIDFGQNALFR